MENELLKDDSSNEGDKMDIDEALEETGPCGRFQMILQVVFMSLILTIGYHAVANYFIAHDPPWVCVSEANDTFCKENVGKHFAAGSKEFSYRCQLKRNEWMYTTDKTYSIVTEFDLVCDKTSIAAFASGAFYIGGIFGCILSGIIADIKGRKIVLINTLTLTFVFSIACSFAKNAWQLTVLRSLLGAVQMSTYSTGFIILSEFVPLSYRTASANMYQLTFCLSELILDLAAYFVKKWRKLQFYTTFPCLLPLMLFFFLPNSPRWLLAKKRQNEAVDVINRISRCNGKNISDIISLKPLNICSSKKYTYIDLFRNWRVFILTAIQCFIWMAVAFIYYAIALESSNLGGDMYQAFALSAAADLPGNFAALYACKYLGRKKSVLGSIFLSGLWIGALALVPTSYANRYAVNITLAMLSKFLIDLAFNGIFIWTFELFPTVLRSQGLSLCISWERLGAFGAPFLTSILQNESYILPYIIMCGVAIICSLAGLVLPETNKLPTRETYEDFFVKPQGYQAIDEPSADNLNDETNRI